MLELWQRLPIESNRTRARFENGVESVFSSEIGVNCRSKGSTEKYAFYVLRFEISFFLTSICFLMAKIPNEIGKIAVIVICNTVYYKF